MRRFILTVLWVAPFLFLAQSCGFFGDNCRGLDPSPVRSGVYTSSNAPESPGLRDTDGATTLQIDRENSAMSISYTDVDGHEVVERWTMLNPRTN